MKSEGQITCSEVYENFETSRFSMIGKIFISVDLLRIYGVLISFDAFELLTRFKGFYGFWRPEIFQDFSDCLDI